MSRDNLVLCLLNYGQVSGTRTLAENIADLGGVNLAYNVEDPCLNWPHLILVQADKYFLRYDFYRFMVILGQT